jgi:hypothetical protein
VLKQLADHVNNVLFQMSLMSCSPNISAIRQGAPGKILLDVVYPVAAHTLAAMRQADVKAVHRRVFVANPVGQTFSLSSNPRVGAFLPR